MQTEIAEKIYTAREYLAFEKRAKNKHEYYNGKIVKFHGKSVTHNQIAANVTAALVTALYEREFVVSTSDTKIYVPRFETFVYPDAVVVFEKAEYYNRKRDVIANPLLIVEFVSRSAFFRFYKTLPSFKEYVLVEQTKPWIIASYKIAERTWQDTEATSLDGSVYLRSVDCNIELKRVYHGVPFDKTV